MTSLPVDYRKAPWKHKYLTEETSVLNYWFIFGRYEDGTVGVSDGSADIFEHMPRDVAERMVAARSAFCSVIEKELGYGS